jgi:ABC-type nitrate/sulfonate/bicarbonate transport system ATPase subunit
MALANRPLVLLLDEPFGALDAITRRQLQHFYWQHVHGRVTAVFVTHDLEEALLIGDIVRVGVTPTAAMIEVDKQDLPPHQWELHENFSRLRANLIAALEDSAALSATGR